MSWRDLRRHVHGLHNLHVWIEDGILVTSYQNMRALIKEGLLLATHLSYFQREDIAIDWNLSDVDYLCKLAEEPHT